MFLFSVRLSLKRVVVGVLAVVIVGGLCVTGVRALRGGEEMASTVTPISDTGGEQVKTEKVKPQKVAAKTNEDRVAYIQSFGWEVAPEPAEVQEVIIPEEFDAVYTDYNTMQKVQGYDLEKYAGKRCKRYSYIITNYPDCTDEVRCNILVSGDRVVGGDVCSTMQDGFMHGFAPQQ